MKCLVCCIKPEHFGGSGQLMHGPFAATTLRSKLAEMQALSMSSPGMEEASLLLEASLAAEAGRFDEAQACYQRADAILAELGMTMTRHMMRQHRLRARDRFSGGPGDCLPRPRARTPPGGSGRRGSRVRRAGD